MRIICIILLTIAVPAAALAHTPTSGDMQERLASLASLAFLLTVWLIYLHGCWRVRPRLHLAVLAHVALLVCLAAVLGPLDEWAETNTAAHMTQHMLLMVVVAPLWVLARPLPQMTAGSGKWLYRLWRPVLRLTEYPVMMAYLHGAIIWLWHMPYFYLLALDHPWWHIFEHACFLITAVLFWWAVLKCSRPRTAFALLAVLLTLMHTGFLGALLTFAPESLYGASRPVAHQQLAGLIMWVAGAVPYLTASAWIARHWYREAWTSQDAPVPCAVTVADSPFRQAQSDKRRAADEAGEG